MSSAQTKQGVQSQSRQMKSGPWLHAWHDPVASIKAHSSCVRLVDLNGDRSNILLVADENKKMRVYKGTSIVAEHQLLDHPVSMCVFYTSSGSNSMPAVGIAGGSYVFIYRHLRPYFKFSLPCIELDPQDESIWQEMTSEQIDSEAGYQMLSQARDGGAKLSSWSLDFLSLEKEDQRYAYVQAKKGVEHKQHTVVTCMETMKKDHDAEDAVSSLVIGTENNQILILDPSGSKVICQAMLPSTPTIMAITGLYDVEWRIVVACRDGKIYTIKNGETRGNAVVTGIVIELETQPNALARIEKYIYVTTMEGSLSCYHIKGRKVFSLSLPSPATCLGVAKISRSRVMEALIVSLGNGEVRLYNGKHMIHSLQMDDVVVAMRWGQFGREQNSCALIGRSGSLTLKMMSRNANLEKGDKISGPPAEQDIPLKVPKKTKLFVEQSEREVLNATQMHRIFQRDLVKLRLTTARSYVKVITSGEAGVSMGGGGRGGVTNVRLNASVVGLGPIFNLKVEVTNGGVASLRDLPLSVVYNTGVYRSDKPAVNIPLLLSNVTVTVTLKLRNIHPEGAGENIRVVLGNKNSSVPLAAALITMPMSEIEE